MAASINRFCWIGNCRNSVKFSSRLFLPSLNFNHVVSSDFLIHCFKRCYNIPSTKYPPSQKKTEVVPNENISGNGEDKHAKLDGYYPEKSRFPVFDDMVRTRRKQAAHSVVVQVSSSKSESATKDACKNFGKVQNIMHYSLPLQEIFVVEFESEDSVEKLLKTCSHTNASNVIPSVSPFVWLRAGSVSRPSEIEEEPDTDSPKTHRKDFREALTHAKSISDQIGIYHSYTRISEVNQRLRWITCHHIEKIFSGLFPHILVHPYGSSINGCGRNGSDVDMLLIPSSLSGNPDTKKTPFMFQAKAINRDPRSHLRSEIDVIGSFLQHYATGIKVSQKIRNARVPIIKFHQEMTGLDCDLSCSAQTAIPMTELIYVYGEMDWRFRPLIFAVRLWAETSQLTRSIAGPTITNFSLTMLLIFYLQGLKQPILPTLNEMIKAAQPKDQVIVADVNCTFLRNPSTFSVRAQKNTQSLEDLFVGFLQFLNRFQFSEFAVSIVTGRFTSKVREDANPLHIQNPLERELNVSKNVNSSEVLRIATEAHAALRRLENCSDQQWGILNFFESGPINSMIKVSNGLDLHEVMKMGKDSTEERVQTEASRTAIPIHQDEPKNTNATKMQAAVVRKSEKKSSSSIKKTKSNHD